MKPKIRLLLDSGVFSAWKKGLPLPLKEYIAYIKKHEHLLWHYVSVDVIPGKRFEKRSADEVEHSAKQGYKNFQIMLDAGLKPVPVFHQGENFVWLEKLIKDGTPYIGISSAKDLVASEQGRWLDDVFSVLTNAKGQPLVKTHGFGISKPAFLTRYPWFSCDSTTWSILPGYGRILMPSLIHGKFDYGQSTAIHISDVEPGNRKFAQKSRFDIMGRTAQDLVRSYLEKEVGISLTEARYLSDSRRKALLIFFRNLCDGLGEVLFTHKSSMQHSDVDMSKFKAYKREPLNLMYATSIANRNFSELLNTVGAQRRLLSYWETKDRSSEELEAYVMTGSMMHGPRRTMRRGDHNDETLRNRIRKTIMKREQEEKELPWNE